MKLFSDPLWYLEWGEDEEQAWLAAEPTFSSSIAARKYFITLYKHFTIRWFIKDHQRLYLSNNVLISHSQFHSSFLIFLHFKYVVL